MPTECGPLVILVVLQVDREGGSDPGAHQYELDGAIVECY